jgi:hypothetical protein
MISMYVAPWGATKERDWRCWLFLTFVFNLNRVDQGVVLDGRKVEINQALCSRLYVMKYDLVVPSLFWLTISKLFRSVVPSPYTSNATADATRAAVRNSKPSFREVKADAVIAIGHHRDAVMKMDVTYPLKQPGVGPA